MWLQRCRGLVRRFSQVCVFSSRRGRHLVGLTRSNSRAALAQSGNSARLGVARGQRDLQRKVEILGSMFEMNGSGPADLRIIGVMFVQRSKEFTTVADMSTQAPQTSRLKRHAAKSRHPIDLRLAQPGKCLDQALFEHRPCPIRAPSVAKMTSDTRFFNPALWGGQGAPKVTQELGQTPQVHTIVVLNALELRLRVGRCGASEKLREHGRDERGGNITASRSSESRDLERDQATIRQAIAPQPPREVKQIEVRGATFERDRLSQPEPRQSPAQER